MNKKIIYIGLGKMGRGMVQHLVEHGYDIFASDPAAEARESVEGQTVTTYEHPADAVRAGLAQGCTVVWLMVPQQYVDAVIGDISPVLPAGALVIDGGNSRYTMAEVRRDVLQPLGVHFMDVGVSGGPEGARNGACLMIGGERDLYETHESLFQHLSAAGAYKYLGLHGAGHFVKMVHNGIEYGMMQSIAEGFNMIRSSQFDASLIDVADIYQHKSVITSRLVGWLQQGFDVYGEDLLDVDGSVGASGEGQWTLEDAQRLGVPVPSIQVALQTRIDSQNDPSYLGKLLQTMRNMFGGHVGHNDISS